MLSTNNQQSIAGILLAAGKSQRFGSNKLLYKINNEPVAAIAARKLKSALPDSIAIIRPNDQETRALIENEGLTVLEYKNAGQGMGCSLAYGIRNSWHAKGWVITLADMPFISENTIQTVADAIHHGASIAAPVHNRQRGHPVGFNRLYRNALSSLNNDIGARDIVAQNKNALLEIAVDDPGILIDIDRPLHTNKQSTSIQNLF